MHLHRATRRIGERATAGLLAIAFSTGIVLFGAAAIAAPRAVTGSLSIRVGTSTVSIPFSGTVSATQGPGGSFVSMTVPAGLIAGTATASGTTTGPPVFLSATNGTATFAVHPTNEWIIGPMGFAGSISIGGIPVPLAGIGVGSNSTVTGVTQSGAAYTLLGDSFGAAAKATIAWPPWREHQGLQSPQPSRKVKKRNFTTFSDASFIQLTVESSDNVREGPLGTEGSTLLGGGKLQLTSPFVLIGEAVGPGYIIGNTTLEINVVSDVPAVSKVGLAVAAALWLAVTATWLYRRRRVAA